MEGRAAGFQQPTVRTADGRREFACFPAAILGFLINERDEILLLSHPSRKGGFEVINGAVEHGESPLEAFYRETREEAGPRVQMKPVSAFHTFLYRFDSRVPAMFSIAYVATYLGGDIEPGHDMAGSSVRWVALPEIVEGRMNILVPSQAWLFRRAVMVHSLLKTDEVTLEPWQSFEALDVAKSQRVLAAVMFTDVVGSTETTVSVGDTKWVEMLQAHDRTVHRIASALGGRFLKSTGDGAVLTFSSVEDAVVAGKAIQQATRDIGLVIRGGVHVGEVAPLIGDAVGQAVVMASRICDAASADELLVSRTAADLLAGSRCRLGPSRSADLKGFGEHPVFPASV